MATPEIKVLMQPFDIALLDDYTPTNKFMWGVGRKNKLDVPFDDQYAVEKAKLIETDPILKQYPEQLPLREVEIGHLALKNVFTRNIPSYNRELQLIIKDNKLMAAATTKHVILSRNEVYDIVVDTIEKSDITVEFTDIVKKYKNSLTGLLPNKLDTLFAGHLSFGFSIGFGNDYLTKAITFAIALRIEVCTNPIMFLELSTTLGSKLSFETLRTVRINTKKDLPLRIESNTKSILKLATHIDKVIDRNAKIEVTNTQAKQVIGALFGAYSLGNKLKDELFEDLGDKTTYTFGDLFMGISSLVNTFQFRKDSYRAGAKASAIAGVLATVKQDEVPKLVSNCQHYCESHKI
jgi:hypothetical protein